MVILVCGKLCSGKTSYCRALLERRRAVALSSDELMTALFHHQEGEKHDELARAAQAYLYQKAVDITRAGCDVLLDWGFWTRAMRREASAFFQARAIPFEWHYIDISDADWRLNIEARNRAVLAQESMDYYVDEGLLQKMLDRFEPPERAEMDVWHVFERQK